MWITTTTGFFSVTATPDGRIQVRARVRSDLVKLLARVGGRSRILRRPSADYLYRVIVPMKVWRRWAAVLAGDVSSYQNFKMAVGSTDPRRAVIYHKAWDVFREIEAEE